MQYTIIPSFYLYPGFPATDCRTLYMYSIVGNITTPAIYFMLTMTNIPSGGEWKLVPFVSPLWVSCDEPSSHPAESSSVPSCFRLVVLWSTSIPSGMKREWGCGSRCRTFYSFDSVIQQPMFAIGFRKKCIVGGSASNFSRTFRPDRHRVCAYNQVSMRMYARFVRKRAH